MEDDDKKIYPESTKDLYHYKIILRCPDGSEKELPADIFCMLIEKDIVDRVLAIHNKTKNIGMQ